MKKQSLVELRGIAIGAVRSEIRKAGLYPYDVKGAEAYEILDGMCQCKGVEDYLWYQWWSKSGTNQYQLFLRDWRKRK